MQNFTSQANAQWQGGCMLGVDLGRTANTLAISDRPKVDVRAFYRKFKSGSSGTIHYLQRALYFKIASCQNTAGLPKTRNICSDSFVQAITILRGGWGLISAGPRTHNHDTCEIRSTKNEGRRARVLLEIQIWIFF